MTPRTPHTPTSWSELAALLSDAARQRLTRRQALQRALALGVGAPLISAILAACGGDDDDDATSTTASSPTTAAVPTATGPAAAATATSGSPAGTPVEGDATATLGSFATISPPTPTLVGTAQGGGRLTLIFQGELSHLDAQGSYDYQASAVGFGGYQMLARLKGSDTLDYEPMLASAWEASEDKTEWSFTIPPGVMFHDGSVCDAAAVVASFQRFHKLNMGPSPIIQAFIVDPDTDISAVDAQTVRFKINVGTDLFLAMLCSQYGPLVMSPAAMEANKTDADPLAHEFFKENIVGTGPYKLKEWVRNDHITMVRYEEFHRGWEGPHFDEIVFRIVPELATRRQLVESGDADALTQSLTPTDVVAIEEDGNVEVLRYASTDAFWVTMNHVRLADPLVRTAFAYAYPYDDVRDGVYEKLVIKTSGPLTPNTRGYDPNGYIFETDLAQAEQLLTDAGWDFSTPLEYWLDDAGETNQAAAQLFQANLAQLGITLDIVAKEYGAMIDFEYGEMSGEERPHFYEIAGGGWWPDYNDGINQIYPSFYSQSFQTAAGPNRGYYNNARVDEIVDTVRAGVTDEEYTALLIEINDILVRQDPAAIFYGSVQWYTVKQKNLKGFISNPIYIGTYNLYDMYREE